MIALTKWIADEGCACDGSCFYCEVSKFIQMPRDMRLYLFRHVPVPQLKQMLEDATALIQDEVGPGGIVLPGMIAHRYTFMLALYMTQNLHAA